MLYVILFVDMYFIIFEIYIYLYNFKMGKIFEFYYLINMDLLLL